MKLLSIDKMYFKLPEDFVGTKADGLRLLADYIESAPDVVGTEQDIDKDAWASYLETVKLGGKVSGIFGLKHYDDGWKEL